MIRVICVIRGFLLPFHANPWRSVLRSILILFLGIACPFLVTSAAMAAAGVTAGFEMSITEKGAKAGVEKSATAAIQATIDAVAARGGGIVRVPKGVFNTGTIHLKSKVRLFLEKDAILQGSLTVTDYAGSNGAPPALIQIDGQERVSIEGPGTIDGMNLRKPGGEEGFRGYHTIHVQNSKSIAFRDFTVKNAGNYAFMCRNMQGATLTRISIRGGHDGLHAQACRDIKVTDCDFRTGDDTFAGCDNHDIEVTGTKINSSCNGFRLGCDNLLVRDCEFWGPGESAHQSSGRHNMLAAFTHFAPPDRKPQFPSDRWLIDLITLRDVDALYLYDNERGLWQQGQPAKRLIFRNIKATGLMKPLRILGDKRQQLEFLLDSADLSYSSQATAPLAIDVSRFGSLKLKNLTLHHPKGGPVIRAVDGKILTLENVKLLPQSDTPYQIERVAEVIQ